MDGLILGQGRGSEMGFALSQWIIGIAHLLPECTDCWPHGKQKLPAKHQPQKVAVHNCMSRQRGDMSPISSCAGFLSSSR